MPVIDAGRWKVDYLEAGAGPRVILLHSSVSGNRQWRDLIALLAPHRHVVAPNLFGYGQSSRWPGGRAMVLDDQLELISPFLEQAEEPVALVGHSFGGAVAMRTALRYPERIDRLFLIEPNPFHLLQQAPSPRAHDQIMALYDRIVEGARREDWEHAAAPFADYWNGEGSWAAMPRARQIAFSWGMPPVLHEWGAVFDDDSLTTAPTTIRARTCVMAARDTAPAIREIFSVLQHAAPHWRFAEVPEGGHMFPVARPDLANGPIADFVLANPSNCPPVSRTGVA